MKDLIRKILREEVSRRYTKSNPNIEKTIIRHMDKLISQTTPINPPIEENYGMYSQEWCKNGKVVIEARYHIDDDTDEFFAGDLYVDAKEINFLSNMLQVRKPYIFNVIAEWYDDNYTNEFGQKFNHPEFEIFDAIETDDPRKCYEMVDTDKLSREEIVDYLDFQTLKRRSELEQLSDDELSKTYRSVYNARNNGIGVRN
jgi:hypothetical protein